jgi:hypothetical protein
MTAADLLSALDLPDAARVDRRVPKTLLTEHGAPTAADKRRINEGIEQVQWVAALKPTTVGVAAYWDETREYLEIAVLHLVLRATAKLGRLVELLHRAVPYPVMAVAEHGERTQLSLAHKRWSQGEVEKTVLDGDIVAVDPTEVDEPLRAAFLKALSLARQPRGTLFALYQGWMDTMLALHAARRTNAFTVPDDGAAKAARREALGECARLEAAIARLRFLAAKEKQMARQVELNLELKRLQAQYAIALKNL